MKNQIIPDFISHYYLPDRKPFLNLSDLSKEEMEPIVEGLNNRMEEGRMHRGFPDWYFPQREEAEVNLRKAFVNGGGKPSRKAPHYFTLGTSKMIEWVYKEDFNKIEIPIELIKSKLLFSIGDTLWTFSKSYNEKQKWENKWFQGRLYNYEEVEDIVKELQLDLDCEKSRFKHMVACIETFIWCDDELNELLLQLGYECSIPKL